MTDFHVDIEKNLALLQERIRRSAQRATRKPSDITILAVSKNIPVQYIDEAWRLGLRHFGESRIQEAETKITASKWAGAEWHLIGHLQTNKSKRALEIFDVIESIDSLRLAEYLEQLAAEQNKKIRCFVEVKTSPEPAKHGLQPAELDKFLDVTAKGCPHIMFEGLMTVAPYDDNPEKARPFFQQLRELLEKNRGRFQSNSPRLSMGMSHDFEVAIEEGTHLIRIGTALFGQRQYIK